MNTANAGQEIRYGEAVPENRSSNAAPSSSHARVTRGRLVVACILALGWSIAAGVYLTAAPAVEDDEVYEMEHSKKSLRDIERIGGKAAVFTSELNERVAGLWRGRTLAYTIAGLTAVVALAYVLLRDPDAGA